MNKQTCFIWSQHTFLNAIHHLVSFFQQQQKKNTVVSNNYTLLSNVIIMKTDTQLNDHRITEPLVNLVSVEMWKISTLVTSCKWHANSF